MQGMPLRVCSTDVGYGGTAVVLRSGIVPRPDLVLKSGRVCGAGGTKVGKPVLRWGVAVQLTSAN
eukprot:3464025-Rhodomonas_salina.1